MSERLSDIRWTIVGTFAFAMTQWLYVMYLARSATLADVGFYAFAQAIVYPVFTIINLELRRLQVTDLLNPLPFRAYKNYARDSGIVSVAVSSGIAAVLHDDGLLRVVCALAIVKWVDCSADAHYGLLQKKGEMRRVAVSQVARGILGLAAFIVAFELKKSLPSALMATAVAWYFASVVMEHRWCNAIDDSKIQELHKGTTLRILRDGAPLGALMCLNQLHMFAPRWILMHFGGSAAVGLYAPAASLITIGSTFMNAVSQAVLPRMARAHAEHVGTAFKELRRLLLMCSAITGAISVLISYCFDSILVQLIYGRLLEDASPVVVQLGWAALFWYVAGALGTTLTAKRLNRQQAQIAVMVVVATAMSCLLLVPRYGAVGASLGLTIGALTKCVAQAVIEKGWCTSP